MNAVDVKIFQRFYDDASSSTSIHHYLVCGFWCIAFKQRNEVTSWVSYVLRILSGQKKNVLTFG